MAQVCIILLKQLLKSTPVTLSDRPKSCKSGSIFPKSFIGDKYKKYLFTIKEILFYDKKASRNLSIGDQFTVTHPLGLDIAKLCTFVFLVFRIRSFVKDHIRISLERKDMGTDTIQKPTVV